MTMKENLLLTAPADSSPSLPNLSPLSVHSLLKYSKVSACIIYFIQ